MLEPAAARDRAASLVELARRKGADAADAVYVGDRSQGVSVRLGQLEDVHRSEGEEIGLRVFIGKRNATVASSDLSNEAMETLVERALAMAAEAPEDQYAGLAPEELLFRGAPADLDLDDGGDPDPAELRERALAAEDAARAVEGVTNSGGAGASASASTFAIANSNGFAAATRATGYSNSVSVVAGTGSTMQRDYAWHSARHLADLEAAQEIGDRAARRAVSRLNPVSIKAGRHAGAVRSARRDHFARPFRRRDQRFGDRAADQLPARRTRNQVFAPRASRSTTILSASAVSAAARSMAKGFRCGR